MDENSPPEAASLCKEARTVDGAQGGQGGVAEAETEGEGPRVDPRADLLRARLGRGNARYHAALALRLRVALWGLRRLRQRQLHTKEMLMSDTRAHSRSNARTDLLFIIFLGALAVAVSLSEQYSYRLVKQRLHFVISHLKIKRTKVHMCMSTKYRRWHATAVQHVRATLVQAWQSNIFVLMSSRLWPICWL